MELVYLWVEDYKNIQKQGFNFSPRFKCEYDEKSNELTIDEDKEYMSIFPENINVTAIVGENGSGKSALLSSVAFSLEKLIRSLIQEKNLVYVIYFNDILYIISNQSIIVISPSPNTIIQLENIRYDKKIDNSQLKGFLASFNTSFYDYALNIVDLKLKNSYPNKLHTIDEIKKNDIGLIFDYIVQDKYERYFQNYFSPTEIHIVSNSKYNPRISKTYDRKRYQNISFLSDKLTSGTSVEKYIFVIYTYIAYLLSKMSVNDNLFPLIKINTLDDYEEKLILIYESLIKNYLKPGIVLIPHLNYKEEIQKIGEILEYTNKVKLNEKRIEPLFKEPEIDTGLYNGLKFKTQIDKNFLTKNVDLYFLFKDMPECFDIDFQDVKKKKYFLDLSSGEQEIIRIRYYLEMQIKKKAYQIFLFDEPTNLLHPEWQKKLIAYLTEVFKDRKEKIHFLISSHSPFMLSDLPKENVIFLEKGKQVDVDIETFGANIHTLLSHGFFIQKGLMGEFAKGKINKAITKLNQSKLSDDDIKFCENIIKIIGEPLIKRQMQKMLDSKKLTKLDKIDELEAEIELIKHHIELIRNNQ